MRDDGGMKTIAVANRKGGAGRTTIAINLAQALCERTEVALVEAAGPTPTLTWYESGQSLGSCNGLSLPDMLDLLADSGHGFAVVDCSSVQGVALEAIFGRAHLVIAPTRPNPLDIDVTMDFLDRFVANGGRALAVFNMVAPRGVPINADTTFLAAKHAVARTEVRNRVTYREDVNVFTEGTNAAAADEMRSLACEVAEALLPRTFAVGALSAP